MTPPPRTSRDIANWLRSRIDTGKHRAGDLLPKIRDLAGDLGVDPSVVNSAYRQLRDEGRVESRRGHGTIVLDPAQRHRFTSPVMERDERGYYLNANNRQGWELLHHGGITHGPAPADIAPLLEIPAGSEVVIRDRTLGLSRSPAAGRNHEQPMVAATSHLPAWLAAELPIVAESDTGPGGIYDRIEDHYHRRLIWRLITSAELATTDLAKRLSIPRQSAILRQRRVTRVLDGPVVEVLDQRLPGDRFESEQDIPRGPSATWW